MPTHVRSVRGVAARSAASPPTCCSRDGVIAEVGDRPEAFRRRRSSTPTGWSPCPAWSTCTPTCASPAARTPRRSSPARRAAALGGFTAVHAMANTDPVADTAGVVEQVWRLGREAGWVDVRPVGAVTVGLRRRAAGRAGRDGRLRGPGAGLLRRRALRRRRRADAPGPGVRQGVRRGDRPARRGAAADRGRPDARGRGLRAARPARAGRRWPRRRSSPATCCWPSTSGSRLHVCHVSTAGSVEILRWAKGRGVGRHRRGHPAPPAAHRRAGARATTRCSRSTRRCGPATTCRRCGPRWPTARSTSVATDHAPHAGEDKDCEWAAAAVGHDRAGDGAVGRPGGHGRHRAARLGRRRRPDVGARRPGSAGSPGTGRGLVAGAPANLTLVDPAARWTVRPAALASGSRNTPYAGASCPAGWWRRSCAAGPTVLDGVPVDGPGPQPRRRGRRVSARAAGDAGARGRPDLPRRGVRRASARPSARRCSPPA